MRPRERPRQDRSTTTPRRRGRGLAALLVVLALLLAAGPTALGLHVHDKLTADDAEDGDGRDVAAANVPPEANFSFTPASPDVTDAVQFTDLSTDDDGTVVHWSWDFDNDGVDDATVQDPVHTFSAAGTYTVRLTVTDDGGAADEALKDVTVTTVRPDADFSFTPTDPTTAQTVQFTDESTHSDGTVVAWTWDLGDGNTSTLQDPAHSYADDGTYTVCLTVTDDGGVEDTTCKDVTVINVGPNADFSFTPASPDETDAVQFTDASTDSDGTVVAWAWDFGDGATSTAQNPSHGYADGGTYTVTLTVTDDDGKTDTTTQDVPVAHVPPIADFDHAPENPTIFDTVQFTDQSTHPNAPVDAIVAWSWDFGDGTTSTEQHPTHQYDQCGTYTVTLTVTDDDGQTDTTTQTIDVWLVYEELPLIGPVGLCLP